MAKWIECGLPWYSWSPKTPLEDRDSFTKRGLAKPGVQIELVSGKRHLIGDINTAGGVCDDCPAFEPEEIIARYRVLLDTRSMT